MIDVNYRPNRFASGTKAWRYPRGAKARAIVERNQPSGQLENDLRPPVRPSCAPVESLEFTSNKEDSGVPGPLSSLPDDARSSSLSLTAAILPGAPVLYTGSVGELGEPQLIDQFGLVSNVCL